jgi:hypothetical protein
METILQIVLFTIVRYAVVIAVVSLVIGLGFLIFGLKIAKSMRTTSKALGRAAAGANKVPIIFKPFTYNYRFFGLPSWDPLAFCFTAFSSSS